MFLGQDQKSTRERLQISVCYPHVLVSTNVIYSALSLTSILSYITTGGKAWDVSGI